jgi:hypothetical protein
MIGCRVASEAFSALAKVKVLKKLVIQYLVDPAVLPAIGRNLVRQVLPGASREVVDGILEHCPNLQYLELYCDVLDEDAEEMEKFVGLFKNGLKRLNDKTIRLGTDWEGYE